MKGRAAAKGKPTPQPQVGGGDSVIQEEKWVFVPVSEHLRIPEIEAATRIGEFDAGIQAQGNWTDAQFLGVDRLDFPKAAYWRYDFAPASLGALMNALAVTPDGILLPRKFMRENAIRVGEPIQVRVSSYGERADMTMTVVGDFRPLPNVVSRGRRRNPADCRQS